MVGSVVFAEKRVPAAQFSAASSVAASRDVPSVGPQFEDRAVEQEMLALGHRARVDMLLNQGSLNQRTSPLPVVAVQLGPATK
jgi:hypothetical protein